MKLKTLFIINAIIILPSGLSFLIAPAYFMSISGITLSTGGQYLVQLLGVAYIAISVLCWLIKNAEDSTALRAIIASSFVHTGLGTIIAAYAQISGVVNSYGWITVVLYFSLSVSYGYFLFKKA
jgi:hypothetical protein